MSAGSLTQHGFRSPLSGGRRAVRAGTFAAPALVTVGVLVGLGTALRLYGLGHQGFWFDEANTAQLVQFSPGRMLGLIPQTESTPPLYYCVAWVWARCSVTTRPGCARCRRCAACWRSRSPTSSPRT
ncbi:MAG: hypothetical protein ACXVRW_13770 [Solirubrobacteraceae bacterium]